MSILDTNGNEIVWLQNFPNDQDVENLEIGAGKSSFGKKYFPLCYLLDQKCNGLPHFSDIEDYHLNDCHYLDHIGDFASLDVNGKQFSNIVFCNPYGIGFMGEGYTKEFLNKTASMLRINGLIHIIGHASNTWSNYRNANRRTQKLSQEGQLNSRFQLSELTTLTADHEYVRDNYFTQTDINKQTTPNQLFTITKIQ